MTKQPHSKKWVLKIINVNWNFSKINKILFQFKFSPLSQHYNEHTQSFLIIYVIYDKKSFQNVVLSNVPANIIV